MSSFGSSCQLCQKLTGTENLNSAKTFQRQQIVITGYDEFGFAFDGRFQYRIVVGIARDCVQGFGNVHHAQEAQIVRQRLGALFGRKPQLQLQFLGQFFQQLQTGDGFNPTGPRVLYSLKRVAASAGGGEKDVGIEDNSQRHG